MAKVELPKDIIRHFVELRSSTAIDIAYYIDRSSSLVYALDEFLDRMEISVYQLPTDSLENVVRHLLSALRCPNCGGIHAIVGIYDYKPDGIEKICAPAVEEECVRNVRKLESSRSLGLSL